MSPPIQNSSRSNDKDGLYLRIVCGPANERAARELEQLPQSSREQVWADMIGSGREQMLPNDILQKLEQLDTELQGLHALNPALVLAMQTRLGMDQAFRTHFLRVEDYDVKRAAARVASHFEHKRALFGDDKLGQTIRLTDLSDDDMETLTSGSIQLLPRTDQTGRLVCFHRYREFKFKSPQNLFRAYWYTLMSTFEPHAANLQFVMIGYEVGHHLPVDFETVRQLAVVIKSLPVRMMATHTCYSDRPYMNLIDIIIHVMSKFTRLRLRVHNGTDQECKYRLLMMGIPVDVLPICPDGKLYTENHKQWLQYRSREESRQHGTVEDDGDGMIS